MIAAKSERYKRYFKRGYSLSRRSGEKNNANRQEEQARFQISLKDLWGRLSITQELPPRDQCSGQQETVSERAARASIIPLIAAEIYCLLPTGLAYVLRVARTNRRLG